jgi:outer membrane murein-binding lipoprotein Lpp
MDTPGVYELLQAMRRATMANTARLDSMGATVSSANAEIARLTAEVKALKTGP